ncbi:hypothetical protein JCM11641_005219 [Rhodosporidiobolus odoratus]
MAPTDKRNKGKGKALDQDQHAQPSLLSNAGQLPPQNQDASYIPPAQVLKKYLFAQPHMLHRHSSTKKSNKHLEGSDKRLAHHLSHLSSSAVAQASQAAEHDDLLLPRDNAGMMETEGDLERTWRVTQEDIKQASAVGASEQGFSLTLDEFGPYAVDYTRNGRHLALAGRKGHLAIFDTHTSSLHTELHLNETIRDVSFLHDESFTAVAQKRFVYIYDKSGLEVHQLRQHIEVEKMRFLRWHWLLATVGNPGYLKYHDTSTGVMVAEHRTKLGACRVMGLDEHRAVVGLGHQNGTATLWTPSMSQPAVKLLAHTTPLTSLAFDPSTMGHRMATSSIDGTVKIWETRMWKPISEFGFKKGVKEVEWSQKGMLGVGWGNHVSVFNSLTSPSSRASPSPYLTHSFPSTPVNSLRFTPFADTLTLGHSRGLTSLLVPGAGEPNFDSLESDPFESKRRRREREVNNLLDKIPMDLITLDQDVVGKLDAGVLRAADDENPYKPGFRETPFAKKSRVDRLKVQGKAVVEEDEESASEDDDEEVEGEKRKERAMERARKSDEKKRMRGKTSGLKKALRRRRREVVDHQTIAIKARLDRQRAAAQQAKANKMALAASGGGADGTAGGGGALERFKF